MAIKFTYGGKDYTLEYTRKSVDTMERSGFLLGDIQDKPVSTIPQLFKGAFLANHRRADNELIEEIYKSMPDKINLINELVKLYVEPVDTLFDEPSGSSGNTEWTAEK